MTRSEARSEALREALDVVEALGRDGGRSLVPDDVRRAARGTVEEGDVVRVQRGDGAMQRGRLVADGTGLAWEPVR